MRSALTLRPFILLLVLSAGIFSAARAAGPLQLTDTEPFTAVVAADEAKFVIPVGKRDQWEWNLASTKENLREYSWQVTVENAGETYEFGYSLFKRPGSQPQSGDLAALIKAGQESLWHVFKNGPRRSGGVIANAGVSVSAEGDNVIIRIKGTENVQRLFSSRPEEVTFQMRTEGKRPKTKKVKVTYQS
jgi:hypothetical protein